MGPLYFSPHCNHRVLSVRKCTGVSCYDIYKWAVSNFFHLLISAAIDLFLKKRAFAYFGRAAYAQKMMIVQAWVHHSEILNRIVVSWTLNTSISSVFRTSWIDNNSILMFHLLRIFPRTNRHDKAWVLFSFNSTIISIILNTRGNWRQKLWINFMHLFFPVRW
jgi:hypothetical protein